MLFCTVLGSKTALEVVPTIQLCCATLAVRRIKEESNDQLCFALS